MRSGRRGWKWLAAIVALLAATPAGAARAATTRGGPDPLPALLAGDWDDLTRAQVADAVRSLGSAACVTLSGYSGLADARAREHAVRAMADAGCAVEEDYRPFYADRAPWVADAILDAATRRRLYGAWPYIVAHLVDRRRLVSESGGSTIEQSAHRVLRRLTGQPIPFAPGASEAVRDRSAASWRSWFAAHGSEPPETWMTSGLAACREALAGSDAVARMAALETLALVGERGTGVLRDALLRAPGEIEATLACEPDGPPRVGDTVPCTLLIRNRSSRRIALALGPAALSMAPSLPPPPPAPEPGTKRRAGGTTKSAAPDAGRGGEVPAAGKAASPQAAGGAPGGPIDLPSDCFVDLLPGGVASRPLVAGPVWTAGRYEARAAVPDWSAALPPGNPRQPGRIEAAVEVRFEQ